jgi:Phosphatidylserine/phosphatidylglycerophosphate/cardiolipin synthases and related enzymes
MATSSLDVCMYIITSQVLSETIARLHRKGVSVRVVADADMADGSGTRIPILRKYGKEKFQMFFGILNTQAGESTGERCVLMCIIL